ncbi:MAG TPA: hypothetical protein VI653_02900, partial [Steroidobacteraceae bacterium]
DEQGFAGSGGDKEARQDMFSHFDTRHPLYRAIAELARIRRENVALRRGRQLVRSHGPKPGLFAVSRIDPNTGAETVVAFNTSTKPISAQVVIGAQSLHFLSMHGHCGAAPTAPGSYRVEIPALDYVACAAVAGK